jgi:hypothetical protein
MRRLEGGHEDQVFREAGGSVRISVLIRKQALTDASMMRPVEPLLDALQAFFEVVPFPRCGLIS